VHDKFSKNRSWAYFEKQKGVSLFAFRTVRNQPQDMGPYYLSKSVAGFAQIIYVQLQFFDHLAHDFIAKGLSALGSKIATSGNGEHLWILRVGCPTGSWVGRQDCPSDSGISLGLALPGADEMFTELNLGCFGNPFPSRTGWAHRNRPTYCEAFLQFRATPFSAICAISTQVLRSVLLVL